MSFNSRPAARPVSGAEVYLVPVVATGELVLDDRVELID